MPATTCGPLRSSISVTATEAPSRASSSAHAAPIPDAPPVTNATLPSTCPVISTPVIIVLVDSSDHRRPLIGHGDIEHAKLHPLGALPAVDRDRSCHMQGLAAIGRQRVAEFLSDRTERD